MRWSSFLIVAVAAFSLFSCKKAEEKAVVQKEVKLPKMEETFPFSEADKIEVISYPVRREWDTIVNEKGWDVVDIVKDKKLQVNPNGIKDRVILNEKLEKELFNIIFTPYHPTESAACFDPRHAILFYNKKSEIIAYIEICFDCGNYEFSNNFKHEPFSVGKLMRIFKDAGIKYFGE